MQKYDTRFRVEPRSPFARAGGMKNFKKLAPEGQIVHRQKHKAEQDNVDAFVKFHHLEFGDSPVFETKKGAQALIAAMNDRLSDVPPLFICEFFEG